MVNSLDNNATYGSEAKKTYGTFPIDMYVLNASLTGVNYLYYVNNNQNIYGFQLNASGNITATEQEYTGLPIKRDVISSNTKGEIAGVTITIPNVDRTLEAVIQNQRYLRGREVHIITGFAKYLPAGSTATHIGETADKNTFMREKYYINSAKSNEEAISFDCKSKFSLTKAQLPGRTFSRACSWLIVDEYRGTYCDASQLITVATQCDGSLEACRARNNEKRFGGFVGVPRDSIFIT